MNRRSDIFIPIFGALAMIVLILDGKTALIGAQEGLDLCLKTLIPTLFPFFFLTNILSSSLIGRNIKLLRPIGRLCKIPEGAESILVIGLLGGYPIGAQCIGTAYEAGGLSLRDARRMLAFCNNCGPGFLFGITGSLFSDPSISWLLFGIHFISAVAVGVIVPGAPGLCKAVATIKPSPVKALRNSIHATAGVCGWVVLFKVLLSFLNRWFLWYFPASVQIGLIGILELSNGCIALHQIENTSLKLILCAGIFGFGGLCVTMQTWFAAGNVDKKLYFPGKLLQAALSMTLVSLIYDPKMSLLPVTGSIILGIFLRKSEKRCRNPQPLVV